MGPTSATTELRPEETLGILALPGVVRQRSSEGLGWPRMYLSRQSEQPYRADFGAVGNHLLILHLDGPVKVSRGQGRTRRTRVIGAGGLFLQPAGRDLSVHLGGPLRTLHLYLDGSLVADAGGSPVELAEEIGSSDPLLEQLMLALDGALQTYTPQSRLYVDSLRTAAAAQLAERHSVRAQASGPLAAAGRRPGLAERDLALVVDLMQERLGSGLALAELAGAVALSESQFARAFKARTGLPPHRYLIGLRLEQAQRLLRGSDRAIADIATACGFASQEHLTRVMAARLGVTPGALRSSGR